MAAVRVYICENDFLHDNHCKNVSTFFRFAKMFV
jgi:hypothetical protein